MGEKQQKSVKNEVGFWSSLISGFITIVTLFVKEIPLWLLIVWLILVLCSIIILFSIFLSKFFKHLKSVKTQKMITSKILYSFQNRLKFCFKDMHILAHDIRNYTCAESHMDNKYTELVCRNICEQIQKIFNHLWNKNQVSVCIKRIVAGKNTNANYREWKTETIAGNYSDHNRYNLDDKKTPITNDSDFFIIVSPDHIDSIFSCSDLTKVEEEFLKKYGMKYEKFPTNYLEFYKSTIVAPIRIKSSNVNPSLRNNNMGNYHLVGFLCIDTKEVFSEDEILFEIGVELTKTFADMLYKLLENNIVYYVNKKGKNNP